MIGNYEAQRERILVPGWHMLEDRFALADATAVPAMLLDVPLIVTNESSVRALSNVCTHRGALLLDGPCHTRTIRCPYHGRRFRLDGSIDVAPGFSHVDDQERLPSVSIASFGPLFFASLAPNVAFDDILAPLRERLSFFDLDALAIDRQVSRAYDIEANWILWCENYLEGFHIPYVHPRLARALDLDRYSIETFDHAALQIGEAAPEESCFALPSGHPDHGRRIGGYYVFLYPSTALNFYPWGLSLNRVLPLGPTHTRIEYRAYVCKPELRESGAGAGLDRVEHEDDAIVERAQRGMSSRLFRPGALHPEHERAVRWLQERIAADG